MNSTFQHQHWTVKSEIDGRLRIHHPGLANSPGLRRHCGETLNHARWLYSHRINAISSTVVVRFPNHERSKLLKLLERCFVDPFSDTNLEFVLSQENQFADIYRRKTFQNAIKTGSICAIILIIDAAFILPPLALLSAAVILSAPTVAEFFKEIQERFVDQKNKNIILPHSVLEIALSTTLIGSGLAKETLVDGLFGSSTNALRALSQSPEGGNPEFHHFVDRIKENVMIKNVQGSSSQIKELKLGEVKEGMVFKVEEGQHVLVHSEIIEGEVIVVNSLLDGSTLPCRHKKGDQVEFGAAIIKGQALCKVLEDFQSCIAFKLDETFLSDCSPGAVETFNSTTYQVIAPPIQLALGLWSLSLGLTERAIGFFAFNPFKDSQLSKDSCAETALVDMAINKVFISDVRTLAELSKVNRVLISINMLRKFGSFSTKENHIDVGLTDNFLHQLLYSLVKFFKADPTLIFWGIFTEFNCDPFTIMNVIDELKPNEKCCIYTVYLEENKNPYTIRFYRSNQCKDPAQPSASFVAEFAHDSQPIGTLEVDFTVDQVYTAVFEQLKSINIDLDVIGDIHHFTPEIANDEALYRASKVKNLQDEGHKVAYLGDVIHDIAAMAKADVAIGFAEDTTGFISKTLCDVTLGGNIMWLSRLMLLSRNFEKAANLNSILITGSTLTAAMISFIAAATPLQLVALFNIAPVIAELNTLIALSGPSSSRFQQLQSSQMTAADPC